MLKRYRMRYSDYDEIIYADDADDDRIGHTAEFELYVRYEDAAALELRIRELEQQLMTEAEKRSAFEKDCG